MSVERVVSWLRECYREDRSRTGVHDYFSGKVLHRHLLAGREELATAWMPEVVVSPEYAAKASEHAALYRREQEVVYACLFLCGQHEGRAGCAPFLFYQGCFDPQHPGRFEIDISRWRINPNCLEILDADAESANELLAGGVLDDAVIGSLREWGARHGVDTEALWSWPDLVDAKSLKKAAKGLQLSLLPAAGIGILPRSVSSRGVIDELGGLVKAGESGWSAPLRFMLGGDVLPEHSGSDDFFAVPALLSRSQENILASARVNPVTLCHGPPGTGKSFTIAAIALNHVARGERVLVASHMDHAVDVVQEKIESMIGGEEVTVRAGRRGYLSSLKRFIEACLSGQLTADPVSEAGLARQFSKVKGTMRELLGDERDLEEEWCKALGRGKLMAKSDPNILDRIRRRWTEHVVYRRPLLMELSAHLNDLYVEREQDLGKYIRMQRKHLLHLALQQKEVRKDFKTLLKALRKYRGSEQEAEFRKMDLGSILDVLPVWLVNLSDLHRVLPMEKQLFDVAIIDEASQCDLASVLPVMQRAKRLVIAGDGRQLRHMSFLPRHRQESLAVEAGIKDAEKEQYNYRDVSLMDLASAMVDDSSRIGFLNEHFRSRPGIIDFSNQKFYRGGLQLMRERPWGDQSDALEVRFCEGTRDEATGVNQIEVDAVIDALKSLLVSSSSRTPVKHPSIGVLSPFRNQVEAIRHALGEQLEPNEVNALFHDHDLCLGTAHSFQGEERDVMLLSFAVDPGVGASTLRFVEREDVFNVSITRAKSKQVVFHSLPVTSLPRRGLLADYLNSASVKKVTAPQQAEPDAFTLEVLGELERRGIEVLPMRHVAGVGIDLVLVDGERVMGLDLIGFPGSSFEAVDRHKGKILRRAGFRLFPLGYAEWKSQKAHAISVICYELRHDQRYRMMP
ncbi:ATP-binding protein [Verrucomicrobiaceae bacterium N1E253]|uniref:ATP-binding protein n=1 Tax=Oceaniferula marina TaxID=2748318 RepID=A0A851GAY7_9BACT|nr:ATP-binding protein [Oceaniferula marina]NWK54773.1 ATP-binding protein [Oceaniferula marina]